MDKYCFGIDVGGTTIKCGLFKEDGTLLEKWEIRTRTEENGSYILSDIASSIREKMEEKHLKKEDIIGVGVGVPGPVNEAGELPNGAVNLHWKRINLVEELGKLLDLPVKAGNDANVAALGEMFQGGASGFKNVIFVTLGTGVGGGIVVDGKIVAGAHGAGGEIGHVHVENQETEPCNCGNYGCLEQVASATGIVRLARRKLQKNQKATLLNEQYLSAKSVFDAVKKEDEVAKEIIDEFGYYLGNALSIFAGVVDPEVIVIGGGVSKAGPILLEYIEKYYMKYAFPACREAVFSLAKLGNDAGIYGGAKLILG